jgi:hypothetical protein
LGDSVSDAEFPGITTSGLDGGRQASYAWRCGIPNSARVFRANHRLRVSTGLGEKAVIRHPKASQDNRLICHAIIPSIGLPNFSFHEEKRNTQVILFPSHYKLMFSRVFSLVLILPLSASSTGSNLFQVVRFVQSRHLSVNLHTRV